MEGRPDVPDAPDPGHPQPHPRPEPDPFPGYGEPPPDVRRDSPPNVPRRDWGSPGDTGP